MILFPLMTTWMWFQIFHSITASVFESPTEDASDTDMSLLPVLFKGDRI
jgi:hypothetical protein